MKHLVFFGIQGSGKGTQANLLAKDYGYVVFSTGNELRRHIQEKTEIGQKVESIMNAGNHVSDEIILSIVKQFVKDNANSPIIFDGVVRNMNQYNTIQEFFNQNNIETKAVVLELDKQTALERIMSRAEKEGRADDTTEAAQKRIELFFELTEPVIQSYPSEQLVTVNAKNNIETVYQELKTKLNLN